jgi:hypothetical protein
LRLIQHFTPLAIAVYFTLALPLAVVERDEAKAYVVASSEYAAKDRPEIAIETDTIGELYDEISTKRPDLLHPNSRHVMKKPWGAQESAVLDKTGVCMIFRQW